MQQRQRVRHRPHDDVGHRRREQPDADAQVALEQRGPEVDVLLPERQVEPEQVRVVRAHRLHGGGLDTLALASMLCTGSPGMKRGIIQLIVTATKKVSP